LADESPYASVLKKASKILVDWFKQMIIIGSKYVVMFLAFCNLLVKVIIGLL